MRPEARTTSCDAGAPLTSAIATSRAAAPTYHGAAAATPTARAVSTSTVAACVRRARSAPRMILSI